MEIVYLILQKHKIDHCVLYRLKTVSTGNSKERKIALIFGVLGFCISSISSLHRTAAIGYYMDYYRTSCLNPFLKRSSGGYDRLLFSTDYIWIGYPVYLIIVMINERSDMCSLSAPPGITLSFE